MNGLLSACLPDIRSVSPSRRRLLALLAGTASRLLAASRARLADVRTRHSMADATARRARGVGRLGDLLLVASQVCERGRSSDSSACLSLPRSVSPAARELRARGAGSSAHGDARSGRERDRRLDRSFVAPSSPPLARLLVVLASSLSLFCTAPSSPRRPPSLLPVSLGRLDRVKAILFLHLSPSAPPLIATSCAFDQGSSWCTSSSFTPPLRCVCRS